MCSSNTEILKYNSNSINFGLKIKPLRNKYVGVIAYMCLSDAASPLYTLSLCIQTGKINICQFVVGFIQNAVNMQKYRLTYANIISET